VKKTVLKVIVLFVVYVLFCVYYQFLFLKNIGVFLQTCQKVFGLKDSELFTPVDLIDGEGFTKVSVVLFHQLSIQLEDISIIIMYCWCSVLPNSLGNEDTGACCRY